VLGEWGLAAWLAARKPVVRERPEDTRFGSGLMIPFQFTLESGP